MNYREMLDNARKNETAEDIAAQIFQFAEEGDCLVGKLIGVDVFESQMYDTNCMRYVFDTDDGVVSCVLGKATDDRISARLKVGQVLALTYQGKAKTSRGNMVNQFTCELIKDAEPEDSVPF